MPSADQVPTKSSHSRMLWHKWVVLIAGSTGSALRAVRPPNLHITPVVRRDLLYAASATGSLYRSPLTIMAQTIRAILLPSLFLPPLECCFGTIPIQAEKLRPDRKDFGSATVATTAVASTGPTPGASSSLMLISLDRCQALISRSTP